MHIEQSGPVKFGSKHPVRGSRCRDYVRRELGFGRNAVAAHPIVRDFEAVIALMSDHGYRSFDLIDPRFLKTNNFNAVYFPSRDYGLYYDSMSNVNQFRVLLNSLFKQNLPILKDSLSF